MVLCSLRLCVVLAIISSTFAATTKEKCYSCIEVKKCQTFGDLNKEEQGNWIDRYLCEESPEKDLPSSVYGFSARAHGDLVCCPENVWGVDSSKPTEKETYQSLTNSGQQPLINGRRNFENASPYSRGYNNYPVGTGSSNQNGDMSWGSSNNDYPNDDYDSEDRDYYEAQRSPYYQPRRPKQPNTSTTQNPYFLPANSGNRKSNTGSVRNSGGQCPTTSFPPDPASGCCGREASDDDRITDNPSTSNFPKKSNTAQNGWAPQPNNPGYWPPWNNFGRRKRETEVIIDNRIAGGKETELQQFPWTVLLKTTFSYPDKEASFACGGSLISSKYVLTAGHCVYDQQGSVKDVEINLAEYDKRTFPQDCKNVIGKGQVCIENIVMHAEDIMIHPEYDDDKLYNDIALVRLRGNAPYTDYIRPICLPTVDVDSPDLFNFQLTVAGWGRNGNAKSNIKQSTVVNLVPQKDCKSSYPNLTRRQLCAAGYSGEDTCKGDSGGPLMWVYGGKYIVSGVVSGKRADAPCGTSVPSLYTNVYQYVPWIKNIIKY